MFEVHAVMLVVSHLRFQFFIMKMLVLLI